jgi:hypothetical protein
VRHESVAKPSFFVTSAPRIGAPISVNKQCASRSSRCRLAARSHDYFIIFLDVYRAYAPSVMTSYVAVAMRTPPFVVVGSRSLLNSAPLRKLFEQRLRVLQVRRIEALGEPAVNVGQ